MSNSRINEADRIAALREYLLDCESEKTLDNMTRLVAGLLDCEIALISIVDENRQWFKSKIGTDLCETSRDIAFCHHAIQEDVILVIEDATLDPRFSNNPLVTESPHIRFYAGAVLKTPEGFPIGTLCVADRKSRKLTPDQREALVNISTFVMSQFELRKKSRELLQEKARFSHLTEVLNALPDFIGTCDLNGKILSFNTAFAENSMISGTADIFKYYPKWVKRMMENEAIPAALEDGIWRGKSAVLLKTGHELQVFQTVICHRDRGGYPAYFSTIMQDLTGIKLKIHSEEQKFISNMSHEIRTPLNAILGHAEILAETISEQNQLGHIRAVRKSGELLLNLINDFLDISRIESGDLRLQKTNFNFEELGDRISNLFSFEAAKKNINFKIDVEKELGTFSGDPVRITQVLIKLVSNAIKFTEQGFVNVVIKRDHNEILMSVEDTGIGINKQHQEIIFDNFQQAEQSPMKPHAGTGLGLAIVRNLIQLMGGSIQVESAPGEGSKFIARLKLDPALPVSTVESSTGFEDSLLDKKLHILVVDDSTENCALIKAYLKKFPFHVDMAGNGEEALARLTTTHYDLVFMDIQMPVMDGLTATKIFRLWEKDNGGHVPIAALTAFSLQEDKDKSLNAGCDLHLTKPVKKSTILQTINDLASGNKDG